MCIHSDEETYMYMGLVFCKNKTPFMILFLHAKENTEDFKYQIQNCYTCGITTPYIKWDIVFQINMLRSGCS